MILLLLFHGPLVLQSSSLLNEDVEDISASESLCWGAGEEPSGAGASGFLKRVSQKKEKKHQYINTTSYSEELPTVATRQSF